MPMLLLKLLSLFAVKPGAVKGGSSDEANNERDENVPKLNHDHTSKLVVSIRRRVGTRLFFDRNRAHRPLVSVVE